MSEATERRDMNKEYELRDVPVLEIDLGIRARVNYGDVKDLSRKIKDKGVITPIAVEFRPDVEKKPYLLLAGGRRFAASVFAELKAIPAKVYKGPLTPLERLEIELMENKDRLDMGFAEEAALTKRIHEAYVAEYGEAVGPSEGHSQRDTAVILKVSHTTVAQNLALAEAIAENPELGGLKTRSDALKAMKKMRQREVAQVAANRYKAEVLHDGGLTAKGNLVRSYVLRDFFDGVHEIPDNSFNVIEMDPPYGIDLKNIKKSDDKESLRNYNEIDEGDYAAFLSDAFKQCYRVLAADGWLICWFAMNPWYSIVKRNLEAAGFDVYGLPAMWIKERFSGQVNRPEMRLASAYEPFFYARKGNAVLQKQGRHNLFQYAPVHPDKKIHPTERPIEMITDVLSTFGHPACSVLVPFLGSGNTLLACANLGFRALGFDLSGEFQNAFIQRVETRDIGKYSSYT